MEPRAFYLKTKIIRSLTWIPKIKELTQSFTSMKTFRLKQTVVLISGKLRARSGPNGDEIYTEMKPGDILTVPSNVIHQVEALENSVFCEAFGPGPNLEKGIQTVYMRKQEIAEAKAKSNQETKG